MCIMAVFFEDGFLLMESFSKEKKFLILALGGIAVIIIVGVILNILDSRRPTGRAKTVSAQVLDLSAVSGNVAGNGDLEMVVISNWRDVTESEVVAEDTEEKKSINLRLENVDGMTPAMDVGYIFVGDSRFVNMNDVCEISKKDNLFMVAKVGQGYNWFNDTALGQIKTIVSSGLFKKWKLVICLGINDLGNLDKYLKKYEALRENYDITLVSVNPVNNYGTISNKEIEKFNSSLRGLSLPYIDTYGLLTTTGYTTTDGLHYNSDTTRKIYDGILLGLEELVPGTLTADTEAGLDKTSLAKKKSIQSQILAQNKYVKTDVAATADPKQVEEALKNQNAAQGQKQNAGNVQTGNQELSPEEMERLLREIEEYERSQGLSPAPQENSDQGGEEQQPEQQENNDQGGEQQPEQPPEQSEQPPEQAPEEGE